MQRLRGTREQGGQNDETPQAMDLSTLLRPYENQWVALSEDHAKVLGAGVTLQDAKRQADKAGNPYRFLKVLPFDVSFVPFGDEVSLREVSL